MDRTVCNHGILIHLECPECEKEYQEGYVYGLEQFRKKITMELEALCWDLISGTVKGPKKCKERIEEGLKNAEELLKGEKSE